MARPSNIPNEVLRHAQEHGIFGRRVWVPAEPVDPSAAPRPGHAPAPGTGGSGHRPKRAPASIGLHGDIVAYLTAVRCLEGREAMQRAAGYVALLGFTPKEVGQLARVIERAHIMVSREKAKRRA